MLRADFTTFFPIVTRSLNFQLCFIVKHNQTTIHKKRWRIVVTTQVRTALSNEPWYKWKQIELFSWFKLLLVSLIFWKNLLYITILPYKLMYNRIVMVLDKLLMQWEHTWPSSERNMTKVMSFLPVAWWYALFSQSPQMP